MKMANALDFAKNIVPGNNILGYQRLNIFKKRRKIVVFVPEELVNVVIYAMAASGAGKIGKYTVCSFRSAGKGTFKGGSGSNPSVGSKGKFETVNEVRLEMVCDSINVDEAINSMLEVHPYEEPAYEIYDVVSGEKILYDKAVKVILKKPVTYQDMMKKLNREIDTSLIPVKTLRKKIFSLIINFSGKELAFHANKDKSTGILYITKLKSGNYEYKF
jgi:hypothetical protein